MFIARATCRLTSVTVIALCSGWSLLCISDSDGAIENEAGCSLSGSGKEETRWWDLSQIRFSCNCNYSLIMHNKTPVHSTWGLLRVCAACLTPRLNLSSEPYPSWNNIQDTFPTRSAPDTTHLQKPKEDRMVLITSKQKNYKICPWSHLVSVCMHIYMNVYRVLISVNVQELRVLRLRHILNFPYFLFNV